MRKQGPGCWCYQRGGLVGGVVFPEVLRHIDVVGGGALVTDVAMAAAGTVVHHPVKALVLQLNESDADGPEEVQPGRVLARGGGVGASESWHQ